MNENLCIVYDVCRKTFIITYNRFCVDVRFNITVTATQGCGSIWPFKSIYIRDPPVDKSKEYTVNVDPVFFKEDLIGM